MSRDKNYWINFTCPSCGEHKIVQTHRTVVQCPIEVAWACPIQNNEYEYTYDISEDEFVDWDNADFICIECMYCGYELPSDEEDLFVWLKEHEMLKEI